MGRRNRIFRQDLPPAASPSRVGPGSVTGRKASGIHIASQPDDWLPPDLGAAHAEEERETTASDWIPPDLPQPTSAPPPPERKRSTVNQVPPELLAAAAAPSPAAPAPETPAAGAAAAAVDLNTASIDDLMRLPGVTRRAAEEIADHRPFATLHDLTRVPGFHAERVARLASHARV